MPTDGIGGQYVPEQDRFWDLAKIFGAIESYCDFEGFAGPEEVNTLLAQEGVRQRIEGAKSDRYDHRGVVKTLTAHYIFDNVDQADYRPTLDEVIVFIDTIIWLLTSRWYMKEDAQ